MKILLGRLTLIKNLLIVCSISYLSACNYNIEPEEKPSFKFTNINLDQVDSEGKKQFKLVTDRAYIIESSKHMKAIDPLVILYYNNEPHYNVNSAIASIVDNGNKIILDKNIVMQSIRNNEFLLETQRLEWNKSKSIIVMNGGIKSTINGSSFKSKSANYNYKKNIIEFYGIDQYKYSDKSMKQFVSVKADSAIWYGAKNKLLFYSNTGNVISNLKVYK